MAALVPYSRKPLVAKVFWINLDVFFTISLNFSGYATIGLNVFPFITIPFRFLEPITAPIPVRPAALPSVHIFANFTKFSPLCPIQRTFDLRSPERIFNFL